MAILSQITFYPIKSCAGVALTEATLTRRGIEHQGIYDREWMLVDASGRFLTQRELPRMALIVPRLAPGVLQVSAPVMPVLELPLRQGAPAGSKLRPVQLWDEPLAAYDCGDGVAAWFTQVLGLACRLVRFDPASERLANARWTAGVAAPTLFSDGYPVLVIGAASLDDLNQKLRQAGRDALPMNRFRPNLVVDQLDAFEEDYTQQFALGATVLKPVKPCPRCPIPTVDQATGVVGPDPVDILRRYRAKPELDGAICFGMNCIVIAGGDELLQVGQEIGVTLAF